MSASLRDPTPPAVQPSYPRLGDADAEEVRQKLLDVVLLLHGGQLTEDQLAEVRKGLSLQSANTEVLHRFRLNNADEPAFALSMNRMPSRDR